MQAFLEGAWDTYDELGKHNSVLATILFTDIVGSTQKIAGLGNRGWSDVLKEHHATLKGVPGEWRLYAVA